MARMWHQRLQPGALGGNSVAHFSVDSRSTPDQVWLVATDGTLWRMGPAGDVAQVDGSRALTHVADLAQSGVLAIDRDNILLSRSGGSQWVQRANPGGPADPFVSITGDGSGRGWLTTRNGRVFATTDGGATFKPDSSGFGSDLSAPRATKACFAAEPDPIRWYLAGPQQVWRRDQFDQTPQVLHNVPDLSVFDISVGPDGMLWLLRSPSGVAMLPPSGFGSPTVVAGGADAFMVVAGPDATAWIGKSDGSLWRLEEG